ncbi:hypothetical protein BsIDN1_71800 [Bacillus safensis]|uniref:Catalase immune-responsive domain-containing protein n=1 Tax=Bacillus safensis TaxID=561879 RepID=A0A5S9MLI9_BACIA|nr:hypothetical protein BsIDN1_71800 [Bacillus safensis]
MERIIRFFFVEGEVKREAIDRPNNFGQAGETYRRFNDWEREELIKNLVNTCDMSKGHSRPNDRKLYKSRP